MASSQPPKPLKPSKPSSFLSSNLFMLELKQRILTSISKLSDRDTHQIAVEDLENIIQTLSPDGVSMLLNCLCDASGDPKPAVKKESLRLLSVLCASHSSSTATHLTKIVAHIVKRLKDSDSGVRDSCRDAIGALSAIYLKGDFENGGFGSVVSVFVKPLFETMNEQNKAVQAGSAICMAKMVDCAAEAPIAALQKLCPKICKFLNSHSFQARAALLSVVISLSQVGAIAQQSMPTLLQSIHDCLHNSDWATRKAAADALIALASHSSHLIVDGTSSTITALEACRFDKVKPVRDSMTEALQLWKNIAVDGGNEVPTGQNAISCGESNLQKAESTEKSDLMRRDPGGILLESAKDAVDVSAAAPDFPTKTKGGGISDKTVGILKKKAPGLTEKELNPEFFQKLETRGSGDLPVEVVVPHKFLNSSNAQGDEESKLSETTYRSRSSEDGVDELDDNHGSSNTKYQSIKREAAEMLNKQNSDYGRQGKWMEQETFRGKDSNSRAFNSNGRADCDQRDLYSGRIGFPKPNGHIEGSFMNIKGNWLAIQRQLSQLERQQAHLMNMLQDFMGGSHDSMVTLDNRVRGLERVVEDMVRDLTITSGRRGGNFTVGFEGSSVRHLRKCNGLQEYSTTKLGRGGDGWSSFPERFLSSDSIFSGARARDLPWRSNVSQQLDSYSYGALRNGLMGSRRALIGDLNDVRPPRSENDGMQIGSRRAWDKGGGSFRLGEGPSARSVWQAAKDEATLEAIRVAGEDDGTSQSAVPVAIPESTSEALGSESAGQDQEPFWTSWNNAVDALHTGDIDTAYAEVLSTGDDLLLVKLMDMSGPVMDHLSNEIANEVLVAVGQFLLEQNLIDIGLSWIQQLVDIAMENGPDVLGIPTESKRDLLLNLHEASSVTGLPENWEGSTPEQLMLQLASAWRIDLQQFGN